MTAVRIVLIIVGCAAGAYGAVLVLGFAPHTILSIGVWAAVGVIVHDFVFAPITAAFGWTARRVIRGRWWVPVAVAALCSVILVLLAVPVYDRQDAKPDNASVLDRNYPLGLAISLVVVWALVPLYAIGATRLTRRQRTAEAEAAPGGES